MILRDAAQQALEYMKSVGQMDMYPEDWAIVGRLEAALAKPETQSTHSADCYKWHHKCAIAEVERLRAHDIGGAT